MINYKGLKIMVDFYENVKFKCWKKKYCFYQSTSFSNCAYGIIPSPKFKTFKSEGVLVFKFTA